MTSLDTACPDCGGLLGLCPCDDTCPDCEQLLADCECGAEGCWLCGEDPEFCDCEREDA